MVAHARQAADFFAFDDFNRDDFWEWTLLYIYITFPDDESLQSKTENRDDPRS